MEMRQKCVPGAMKTLILLAVNLCLITSCAPAPRSNSTAASGIQAPTGDDIQRVNAYLLLLAYQDNEVAADRLYKGQWLVLFGTAEAIRSEGDGAVIQMASSHPWKFEIRYHFDADHRIEVEKLHAGDFVEIAGLCTGRIGGIGGVEIMHCDLRSY